MIKEQDVFYCPNYIKRNGFVHDSWFIVIKGGTPWGSLLCLMGTTRTERFLNTTKGCNSEPERRFKSFFIPLTWQPCFTKDTHVMLPEIYDIPLREFLRLRGENGLLEKGQIDENCLRDLISCLRNFQDDIAIDHWKRLFDTLD